MSFILTNANSVYLVFLCKSSHDKRLSTYDENKFCLEETSGTPYNWFC